MRPRVLFLGGNGHTPARLVPAREALERRHGEAVALLDVPLAGFGGRSRARSYGDFLDQLEQQAARLGSEMEGTTLYATGVGGLYALGLRARGRIARTPLILQGPVLWGLEQRLFPRLMRAVPGAPALLQRLFRLPAVQRRFVGKHLLRPLADREREAFFEGYRQASSFGDLFAWLTPGHLRELEHTFAEHPGRLERIAFWWGERDTVVGPGELASTERALGRSFPLRRFPTWGHYPMLDDPEGWVDALVDEVLARGTATSGALRPGGGRA